MGYCRAGLAPLYTNKRKVPTTAIADAMRTHISNSPRADIAAIVVTYQSASTIADCLNRLRRAQGITQIRVVDNNSRDATLEIVQRQASQDARLHFIANPDNPGFGTACNQGVADSDAPWIALVNPDCMVEPDTLSHLLAHARSLPGEAMIGAILVDQHGHEDPASRRRDPQFAAMLRTRAALNLAVAADTTKPLQQVAAISGALMLMPRKLFTRIGGFDPEYRLHVEDLDLCRRAREAGAIVAIANNARVLHLRGVSSRSKPLFVEWHKHRGMWRYFQKFEAKRSGKLTKAAVWLGIWGHFLLVAALGRR